MTTRILMAIMAVMLMGASGVMAEFDPRTGSLPAEDYVLYDQVITGKFLTSATELVVLERMTRFRLAPDQEGLTTIAAFQEQGYFDGGLPSDLIREFIWLNKESSRLEGRFHFGVRYRFATGDSIEEPEVSLAHPVGLSGVRAVQTSPILERLAFSRVARSLRQDHALLYVEALRPDGTGAGFLVWFRRQEGRWTLFDTEVVWTIQPQGGEQPLAP